MSKYIRYIQNELGERDLLEQLAEECSELSQAAMKLIRAKGMNNNKTSKDKDKAIIDFYEEVKDVACVLYILTESDNYSWIRNYPKIERWARRLGYQEKENRYE